MGWFSRRREHADHSDLIGKLHGKAIRYAARRTVDENGNPVEVILGKQGAINTLGGDIVVMCNAKEVFRCPVEGATCAELMSLGGVIISGTNAVTGEPDTVAAYYTNY